MVQNTVHNNVSDVFLVFLLIEYTGSLITCFLSTNWKWIIKVKISKLIK
jgi:hypothetical protein